MALTRSLRRLFVALRWMVWAVEWIIIWPLGFVMVVMLLSDTPSDACVLLSAHAADVLRAIWLTLALNCVVLSWLTGQYPRKR